MCSPHVPPTPYSRAHVIVLNRLASFSRRTSVRSRCFAVQTPLLDRPADAIVLPVPIGASLPRPRPALVPAACLHARPEAFGEVFMNDQHLCAPLLALALRCCGLRRLRCCRRCRDGFTRLFQFLARPVFGDDDWEDFVAHNPF
jgi:hypothetical protein